MGVTHVVEPLINYFNSTNKNHIIINDIATQTIDNNEILNYVMTTYETDVVSTVPKCDCPDNIALKGRARKGQICSNCGSEVREIYEKTDSNVWLRGIYSSEYGGIVPFISPTFWIQLSKIIYSSNKGKGNIDYLRWMCDEQYKLSPEAMMKDVFKVVNEVVENCMEGKRGYVNFIHNLDRILLFMIEHKEFKRKKYGKTTASKILEYLYEILQDDRRLNDGKGIFSDYLPILNKNIFVMEKNPKGRFCSLLAANNISVVKTWIDLCRDIEERKDSGYAEVSLKKIGKETVKIISTLGELYLEYQANFMYKKSGILRKHFYGARLPFTFRAVIVSRYGPHDRHGIEMPWTIAVTIFRTHLKNKMHRDGLNVREINDLLNRAPNEYIEYVHQLILEILSEAPNGKYPILMQRNPSLTRSSILKLYIDKVLTDPKIKTVAVSQLIVKYCNGDYDGDATNFYILIDDEMSDAMEPFNTKYAIPNPKTVFTLSKYLTLLSTGNHILFELLQNRQNEEDEISGKFKTVKVDIEE